MKTKTVLALAFMLMLNGCGTVTTVLLGDQSTARSLKRARTHCESIPRVYSGVAYSLCTLHARPPSRSVYIEPEHMLAAAFLDLALSGTLDTVALPYTVYRQCQDGNIHIQ